MTGRSKLGSPQDLPAVAARFLPTPTASDSTGPRSSPANGLDLRTATRRLLPTPTAMDSAGARNSTARRKPTPEKVHIGDTLTDAVWKTVGAPSWAKTNLEQTSGAPTPTPSSAGPECSDDQLRFPPTTEDA